MYKLMPGQALEALAELLNACEFFGNFPSQLQHIVTTLIPKPGRNNMRGIGLYPFAVQVVGKGTSVDLDEMGGGKPIQAIRLDKRLGMCGRSLEAECASGGAEHNMYQLCDFPLGHAQLL